MRWMLALLLLLPAVAGTQVASEGQSDNQPSQVDEVLAVDPAGDAKVGRLDEQFNQWGRKNCEAVPRAEYIPTCVEAMFAAGGNDVVIAASDTTGRDAPGLDMIGIDIRDTPDTLTIEWIVRETGPEPERLAQGFPFEEQSYYLEWWDADETNDRGAYYGVFVSRVLSEIPSFSGVIWMICWDGEDQSRCHDVAPGLYGNYAEFRLEPKWIAGTPGVISVDIPRYVLPAFDAGDELPEVYAHTAIHATTDHYSPRVRVTADGEFGTLQSRVSPTHWNRVDALIEEGLSYQLQTALSTSSPPANGMVNDARGETGGSGLDLLSASHHDTPKVFQSVLEMTRPGTEPMVVGDYMSLAQFDLWVGAEWNGIEWSPMVLSRTFSSHYVDENWELAYSESAPRFTFAADTQGTHVELSWSVLRADLPAVEAGTVLGASWPAVANFDNARSYSALDTSVTIAGRSFDPAHNVDYIYPTVNYIFNYDSIPDPSLQPPFAAYDPIGDMSLPTDVSGILDPDYLDLRHLIVDPRDEETVTFSIGVANLANLEVPLGYDGAIFASGIRTDRGDFMVGFWYDENIQQGFCAPDSLIFRENPTDPRLGWHTLPATLQRPGVSNDQQPSDGRAAAIVLHAPTSCFGDSSRLAVMEIGAARTLMARNTAGSLSFWVTDAIDPTPAEEPLVLGLKSAAPSPEDPFGIRNFWDIVGVALAVLALVIASVFAGRRRRLLRRYLAEIEKSSGILDARARDIVLGDIRERLNRDMHRGRINEGHYQIASHRLDGRRGDARIHALGDLLGDVPYGIVSGLRDVLRDGVVTGAERELLRQRIAASTMTSRQKNQVLARLEEWHKSSQQ